MGSSIEGGGSLNEEDKAKVHKTSGFEESEIHLIYHTKYLYPFRRPILWFHCQFCRWSPFINVICQSILAAVMGRYAIPVQEHGPVGVLLLQIQTPR